MLNQTLTKQLILSIIESEKLSINKHDIHTRLHRCVATSKKLIIFAEAFYFIRYEFCKLNFIIGARCSNDELLWGGLAKNLIEELGGKSGITHNQLYRNFLESIGAKSENELDSPPFAQAFNSRWEYFAKTAPLMEALSAIAIYEIFDVPDYQMFLEILERAKVPEEGLVFFRVHANAHHFEMFEDTVTWILQQEGGQEAFDRAKDFVFETQQKMWLGLIECLEGDEAKNLDLDDRLAPVS
jgi:pyrroloquinoline quinone (PQQ) biosynthesis protein C